MSRRFGRLPVGLAALVTGAIALAGCGGSSNHKSAYTAASTSANSGSSGSSASANSGTGTSTTSSLTSAQARYISVCTGGGLSSAVCKCMSSKLESQFHYTAKEYAKVLYDTAKGNPTPDQDSAHTDCQNA